MTTNIFLNGVSQSAFRAFSTKRVALAFLRSSPYNGCRNISYESFRCAASQYGDTRKKASRLSQVQQLLVEAEERASSAVNEPPPPKISLGKIIPPALIFYFRNSIAFEVDIDDPEHGFA